MTALSIAGNVQNFMAQSANANAQDKYQKAIYKTNTQIANDAATVQYGQLQRQQIQQHAAAAQSIGDVMAQARAAIGTGTVAAGESGTSGNSVDALLQEFHAEELRHTSSVIQNQTFADQQIATEALGVRSQQQGRILSALPQPVQKPDFFGSLLRIGSDALSNYGATTTYDPNTKGLVWKHNGKPASIWGP